MQSSASARRTRIEAAAYVLLNCGASVPARSATKLPFTSACEGAALRRVYEECETLIWTAEQRVLALQVPVGPLRVAWPMLARRQQAGQLRRLWASAMDCRS